MISRLVYVCCDRCGMPAGGDECMADDATEARKLARRVGFARKPSASGPKREDLCPRCISSPTGDPTT